MPANHPTPVRIDPSRLTSDDAEILTTLIDTANLTILRKDTKYIVSRTDVNGEEKQYEVQLTHDIYRRERKDNKTGFRYEVVSDTVLGSGSYGSVKEIITTLAPDKNNILHARERISKKGRLKKRVIKIQIISPDKLNLLQLKQEAELMQKVKGLHTKPTIFAEGEAAIVSKKIEGLTLSKLLMESLIPTEQRLPLVIAVLQALNEKVHKQNIIHRDIKPENIIVDLSKTPIKVTFIDYGLSKEAHVDDSLSVGTPGFNAPELAASITNAKSDIYSAGIVTALILGAPSQNLLVARAISSIDPMLGDAQFRDVLTNHCRAMIAPSPEKRPDLETAINQFKALAQQNDENVALAKEASIIKIQKAGITSKNAEKYLDSQKGNYDAIANELIILHKNGKLSEPVIQFLQNVSPLTKQEFKNVSDIFIKVPDHLMQNDKLRENVFSLIEAAIQKNELVLLTRELENSNNLSKFFDLTASDQVDQLINAAPSAEEKQALFHKAVDENLIEVVKKLSLDAEVNINETPAYKSFPLFAAVNNKNLEIVNILLNAPNIDITQVCPKDGMTVFHRATELGQKEIVKTLLPHFDVNQLDGEGRTPLFIAIEQGHQEVIDILLNHPNVEVHVADQPVPPILMAIFNNNLPVVERLLAMEKTDPNVQSIDGDTPLKIAIEEGFKDTLTLLLQHPKLMLEEKDAITIKQNYPELTQLVEEKLASTAAENTNPRFH